MADNSGSAPDAALEHPDGRSGAHEERQRKYLEKKAAQALARLAARDAAVARDDERMSVVSLEELIARRQDGGGEL